ncbi:hypothetical protein [Patulibacter minatonensis]|uniref:hypothetical protein n=1 Tax=Patulibacter minatonensis TaxID=298163 RepID=UPI00047DADBE|nr:hypothetical protein [Patulibacter minatonensis]
MNHDTTTSRTRRVATGAAGLGATASIIALGLAAAGPSSAAVGEPATPRLAGSCNSSYSNPNFLTKYGSKQQKIADGTITEPEFSLDGRKNKRLAYVVEENGIKNVVVTSRGGDVNRNDGGPWQKGTTAAVTQGDADSWAPSLSGFTAKGDAAKGPTKMAFLSKATNLPGAVAGSTSAFTAGAGGGAIKRVNVPGNATGVGISGDSKVVYVTTEDGLYVATGSGAGKKIASGAGMNTPTTTLNGAQAAYGQSGSIYTITKKGRKKKITTGEDPQADGGFPNGGGKQGYVRAISFHRGSTAYKVGIIAGSSAKGVKSFGRATTPTTLNGGGSAVAFGNGAFACLQVQVLESGKNGGYGIPQGQCPSGDVSDVGVSTRYNYLAFSCKSGGLYLFHVGGK